MKRRFERPERRPVQKVASLLARPLRRGLGRMTYVALLVERCRRSAGVFYRCLLESRPAVQGIFLLRFLVGATFAGPLFSGAVNFSLWGGAAIWVCVTLSVYILNGVMDVEEDQINGSSRPVASGKLTVRQAAGIAAGFASISIVGGF